MPTDQQPTDPALAVTVAPDTRERVLGGISGAIKGGAGIGDTDTEFDRVLTAHHQQRVDEAKMHRQNAATYAGVLTTGIDPKTGAPLSPEDEAKYENWYRSAMSAYEKAAGVDKNAKGVIQRARGILEHVIGMGRQQRGMPPIGQGATSPGAQRGIPPPPGAQGAAPSSLSSSPSSPAASAASGPASIGAGATRGLPPPPDASPAAAAAAPAAAATPPSSQQPQEIPANVTQGARGLPPPPAYDEQTAMGGDALRREEAQNDEIRGKVGLTQAEWDAREKEASKLGLKPGTQPFFEWMSGGKVSAAAHLQSATFKTPDGKIISGSYDPTTGEYLDQKGNVVEDAVRMTPSVEAPKPIHYRGTDGQPHFGYQSPDGLFDAQMQPLPKDTPVFSAWMEPQQIVSQGWKEVTQPDGSIQLVPVTSSSVRTRGAPEPPASVVPTGGASSTPNAPGKSGGTTPSASPASPTPSATPARGGKVGKGITVGGKVPPGVTKAYESYNGAQERYNVMEAALPEAQKGDQQAMLNLLANHIGMTMGLQKGARITQAIYGEASESAPWLKRVEAHFDSNGYLTGVVLTPEQMDQMIRLAKVRLDEDKAAWQREIDAAKGGYGMTPDGRSTSRKASAPQIVPAAPATADELAKQLGIHH